MRLRGIIVMFHEKGRWLVTEVLSTGLIYREGGEKFRNGGR
jgi:hypothetical protein